MSLTIGFFAHAPNFTVDWGGKIQYRDLAQNWDVDIATSLEDYLEDLEEITITLDDGASKVNFAEAALLIQVYPTATGRVAGLAYHDTIKSLVVWFVIIMFKENASPPLGDVMDNPLPYSITQHL